MGADCCDHSTLLDPHRGNPAYRRVLWAVLAINALMFVVEIGAGLAAGSAALQADALDFLGDAANYGISLFVVGMALRYRAMAALAKGGTMGLFGLWVVGTVLWHATHGTLPSALTMGAVGVAALAANAAAFGLLWAHRGGDANMRSAWICTRNDVLGNLAVLLAAAGVFGTGAGWPDIVVAAIMAGLALQGAWIVVRQSLSELRRRFRFSVMQKSRKPFETCSQGGSNMTDIDFSLTRRSALFASLASLSQTGTLFAGEKQVITVHKDPTCGCCSGWVQHLQQAGFRTNVLESRDLDAMKTKLGVPDDLAACHTAEVSGYVVEGHVPAAALKRLLAEKPNATGLAVPGMPIGSPGMEGGNPKPYEVVLFGPAGRRSYMRFVGEHAIG